MKRSIFAFLIILTTTAAVWAMDGSGTENDPYLIKSLADFDDFSSDPNYWSAGVYTALATDVNLAGRNYVTAVISPDPSESDSGYQGIQFDGVFDGNNFKIQNLKVNTKADSNYRNDNNCYLGLLGKIGSGCIENLGIENCSIYGDNSSDYCAALTAYNDQGQISKCYSTGSVRTGNWGDMAGGLIGYNSSGQINNCHSTCSVSGTNYVGGLCGQTSQDSSITKSYAAGNVSGEWKVGGLCGLSSGDISDSYATGNISGNDYSNSNFGGLVGYASGNIIGCFASGSVDGKQILGGLCGYDFARIKNCYALGDVYGSMSTKIGGLCGQSVGVIINCYASGQVTSFVESDTVNGLCGVFTGEMFNCFWDTQTTTRTVGLNVPSNYANSRYNIRGLTTEQMQDDNEYLLANWDIAGDESRFGIWYFSDGNYPVLSWQKESLARVPDLKGMDLSQAQSELISAGFQIGNVNQVYSMSVDVNEITGLSCSYGQYRSIGDVIDIFVSKGTGSSDGTAASPYPVASENDLQYIRANSMYSQNFIMTSDIFLSGYKSNTSAFIAPDLPGFNGVFNGNGFKICNLQIDIFNYYSPSSSPCPDYLGLLGAINSEGVIENVSLVRADIIGGEQTKISGLLSGQNSGQIKNSYANGYFIGTYSNEYIGALCGKNYGDISQSGCHAAITLGSNSSFLGCLVGYNMSDANISQCYSKGKVLSDSKTSHSWLVGGISGGNTGSIDNCYSFAFIGDDESDDIENIGGIAGYNGSGGNIENCYYASFIAGYEFADNLGGICGKNRDSTISNCFWDTEVSGLSIGCTNDPYVPGTIDNLQGLSTAAMQSLVTYTDADWDFVDEETNGFNDIWDICDGMNYSKLSWQTPLPGDFTCPDGVDFVDFAVLADTWNLYTGQTAYNQNCDLSDDNTIDYADLAVFIDYWLEGIE